MAEQLTSQLEELTRQLTVRRPPPLQAMTLPPFDGTGDIQEYLTDFEQIARHNRWETEEWGLRLKLNLTGEPRVGIDDADYPALKELLLEKYGLTDDKALQKLKKLKFKIGDDTYVFVSKLRRLMRLAHPTLEPEQREQLAVREFLQMLPAQSPATWALKMQPPQDIETIAKRIRTFEPDAETSRGVRQVGSEEVNPTATESLNGQVIAAIVQGQQALAQGQQATQELLGRLVQQQLDDRHVSSSSRGQSGSAPSEGQRKEERRCWNCHEVGHFARNCPRPKKPKQTGNEGLREQ